MSSPTTNRRGFLVTGAATLGAAAVGYAAGAFLPAPHAPAPTTPATPATTTQDHTVAFHGEHQAGIAEPSPAHAVFLGFDLTPGVDRAELRAVFREWTAIAAALAAGDTSVDPSLVSRELGPASFTMTVGVSGSALDQLSIARPTALVDHPEFVGDRLDPASSGGHLFVQLCAEDALYLGGAVRAVRRAAAGTLTSRWQFNGFQRRTPATADSAPNGRNLMGQIDGTNNIATSRDVAGGPVWIAPEAASPAWLTGGSYVAIRRFRMLLDSWERAGRDTQDRTVGRHLDTGAPLGEQQEFDPVDLAALDAAGAPVIPVDSHVRLATPTRGAGEELRRRSYSYSTGQFGAETGEEDAGLIFVSYQADPTTSFIPVQRRLAESDALNRFTETTASALFAILPGVRDERDWFGRALLG